MGIIYSRAKELLECFPQKHIAVIGDAMLDQYIVGLVNRISPEAPVQVLKVERRSASLGGAGNVARNIVALGASATLVSVIGDDRAGNQLQEIARQDKIHP